MACHKDSESFSERQTSLIVAFDVKHGYILITQGGENFKEIVTIPRQQICDAFVDIIEGKNVKRVKHELIYEGKDLTQEFINELQRHDYMPTTVEKVHVQPGERVPAFCIDKSIAYFGWVFWEQFTSWKIRKLWGSIMKNKRGDWDIQIPTTRSTIIYANESLKLEMDIDHPPEF